VVQAVIVVMLIAGAFCPCPAGEVLPVQAGSTLSSWRQYLDGFTNLLFFAASTMPAACIALFLLRPHDRLLSVDTMRQNRKLIA